jgi:hypothetical protein
MGNEFHGVIFIVILILVVVFAIYIYTQQNLFWPKQKHVWAPESEFEELDIDGISVWRFDKFRDRPHVLYCHGNAGNISHRKYVIDLCDRLELNLFLFDYAGFGKSKGYPTSQGVCNDAERVYLYMRKAGLSPEQIIVWGESLGGAAAIWVASRHPCLYLILLSTFANLKSVAIRPDAGKFAQKLMPLIFYVIDEIPSVDRIKNVKAPIAIMASRDDDLIPFKNGEMLFEAAPGDAASRVGGDENGGYYTGNKLFIEIKGMHSKPDISLENMRELMRFGCLKADSCSRVGDILDQIRAFNGQHLME